MLAAAAAQEPPTAHSLERLAQEYALKYLLETGWAARPVELVREHGRTLLVLEDPGGEPLERLIDGPMETGRFLRLAVAIADTIGQAHRRGLIHKDIKPAHILVDEEKGAAWLTGFGIASSLPREHPAPERPEAIAGTLAYMAPEQTGRMNRSVDARADLYALGVTLYRMLTGALPFAADDPMDWVYCHIARRPIPPAELVAGVPPVLSAIIMKCLAKTAEERYQTAAGLAADLRRCLDQWQDTGGIMPFRPGAHDIPDQLHIPEKLYGREREVATLLEIFDRVAAGGPPELALVAGYSGIGKSSVVNELHKALVPARGLFAAGKFDQYKHDIPYATLAQAFQDLIRMLLGKSETELACWREELRAAVEPNGALMVTLVPDLRLIIGDQPPVPDLPPRDAEYRFQLVIRRFLGVFARPEHPLALFLDDLQWLDSATLSLLADLVTNPELRHLLLVGAYRDNEVDAAHPLRHSLDHIRCSGGAAHEIVLGPLNVDDMLRLVADALRCAPKAAAPLARLVHGKTGGNPFFTIQFLTALADERLLAVDPGCGTWVWNLERIQAKGYTDNVGDLMVAKIARLPEDTREALKTFACMGNVAEGQTLAKVLEHAQEATHDILREAIRAGLVFHRGGDYAFLHDRIQETAYSLIPKEARAGLHLRIGRLLASGLSPEEIGERIFDVVNQLNRGHSLVDSLEERDRIAELNLMAGTRAMQGAAYPSALKYFAVGSALLGDDGWDRTYDVAFALELKRAECEFLTSAFDAALTRLAELWRRAVTLPDLAAVTGLRSALFTTKGQSDLAVNASLDYLHRVGIDWSPQPTEDDVRHEYDVMLQRIGDRSIESLIDLPAMSTPDVCATMGVLKDVIAPAMFTDDNLPALVFGRMVNLSVEHGNSDESCVGYVYAGAVLGAKFGNYAVSRRFGQLAFDLVDKRGMDRFKARIYLAFAIFIVPGTEDIRHALPILRRAFALAHQRGDLTYASYTFPSLTRTQLACGEPLGRVQEEAERGRNYVHGAQFGLMADILATDMAMIRTLRGLTPSLAGLDDDQFNEGQFERHLVENPCLAWAAFSYWVRKLQTWFMAGKFKDALAAAGKADALLPALLPNEITEYHFYTALAHAGAHDSAPADQRRQHLDALAAHQQQLAAWAEHCPVNFADRAILVGAEIARVEGRVLDAERLYEQAIRAARDHGFVHHEALANELAGRFHLERGLETAGFAFLGNARDGFALWGADGKVRQLERLYPRLLRRHPSAAALKGGEALRQIDVTAMIKASQAISAEIELPRLIESVMTIILQNSGADRGLLFLPRENSFEIRAEACAQDSAIEVELRRAPLAEAECPGAVVNTVIRTRESVILDEGARPGPPWNESAYLRLRPPRSAMCLPLLWQGKLVGLLYLESGQATYAFTPDRVALLEVLAARAAISLENARLYSDLQERETRIRRLVDANIIGIIIYGLDGRIIEVNDAFLGMVGYDRADLASGLRWTDLTPAEWLDRDQRLWIPELRVTGRLAPFEKEFFRKDGSRVPVLIGIAAFPDSRDEGVAFILDLTERKKSEQALRRAKQEAERANDAKSQFLASASHDLRQPAQSLMLLIETLAVVLSDHPAAKVVAQMAVAAEAMKGLLDGLLDISRLHAGVVQPQMQATELGSIIERLAEEYRPRAMHKGLVLHMVPVRAKIRTDPLLLERILRNLIDNALKYTDVGRILLGCRHRAGRICFEIHDTGIGIPADQIEKVFDELYQINNPSRDRTHGLGLGLAIARRMAGLLGITIGLDSRPGRGSCFTLGLPAVDFEGGRVRPAED
jgi:PAS domain S-box-containing protein